ncbi:MAG: hypothetical protein PHX21_10020 [bacterium]|nr:hypothetical protein [bacterium]
MKKLLLVFALFTAGCEHSTVENYTNILNVFSVLKQGKSITSVRVDRTYKLNEQSKICIEDAIVILSGKNFIDTLSLSDSLYVSADSIILNPMDTINICVKASGFDSVYGTTVIPDSFIILHPTNNDTVTRGDSVVVKTNLNDFYFFTVYKEDTIFIPQIPVSPGPDSLIKLRFAMVDTLKSGNYRIKIKAYDENYFKYLPPGMSSSGNNPSGLNGGFGVFGSVAAKEIHLYLK